MVVVVIVFAGIVVVPHSNDDSDNALAFSYLLLFVSIVVRISFVAVDIERPYATTTAATTSAAAAAAAASPKSPPQAAGTFLVCVCV